MAATTQPHRAVQGLGLGSSAGIPLTLQGRFALGWLVGWLVGQPARSCWTASHTAGVRQSEGGRYIRCSLVNLLLLQPLHSVRTPSWPYLCQQGAVLQFTNDYMVTSWRYSSWWYLAALVVGSVIGLSYIDTRYICFAAAGMNTAPPCVIIIICNYMRCALIPITQCLR